MRDLSAHHCLTKLVLDCILTELFFSCQSKPVFFLEIYSKSYWNSSGRPVCFLTKKLEAINMSLSLESSTEAVYLISTDKFNWYIRNECWITKCETVPCTCNMVNLKLLTIKHLHCNKFINNTARIILLCINQCTGNIQSEFVIRCGLFLSLCWDNEIREIKGVENCHRLSHLSLSHNRVHQIEGLDGLPVKYLNLVGLVQVILISQNGINKWRIQKTTGNLTEWN